MLHLIPIIVYKVLSRLSGRFLYIICVIEYFFIVNYKSIDQYRLNISNDIKLNSTLDRIRTLRHEITLNYGFRNV
jgi:hypothetical protein